MRVPGALFAALCARRAKATRQNVATASICRVCAARQTVGAQSRARCKKAPHRRQRSCNRTTHMKRITLGLNVAILLTACGGVSTSPAVPKHEIEKKADTKIADAGPPASNEGGNEAK
jgi:hypothetical protein